MGFPWISSPKGYQYALVFHHHEDGTLNFSNKPGRRVYSWRSILVFSAIFMCTNALSYSYGRSTRSNFDSGLLSPAGDIERKHEYNRTYSVAPTNETDEAWKALFPKNGGFIHHPTLATNFSGIAVFHQLHCLKALVNSYYASANNASSSQHTHDLRSEHKALMCAADTNLEDYNYKLDGVTGWGSKRCRDYDGVIRFANQWGGSKYASSQGM